MPNGWTAVSDRGACLDAVRSYLSLSRYARVLLPHEAVRLEWYAAAWFVRARRVALQDEADAELRAALHAEMEGEREVAARCFRRAAEYRRVAVRWERGVDVWPDTVDAVDRDEEGLGESMRRAFPFGVSR